MQASQFVSKCLELTNVSSTYLLGTYLNKKSGNKLLSDCSGMIKGVLWGYPKVVYASNGVPDINSDTLISRCTNVSTNFANIQAGEVVWLPGHIGVYVGNGHVVESTVAWGGSIQVTNLQNINGKGAAHSRTWVKHGKLPYVTYTATATAPSNVTSNSNASYYKAFNNASIVDGLKSIGVDSSLNNRNKIAGINGITKYTGTAAQNKQLLALAKKGTLRKS